VNGRPTRGGRGGRSGGRDTKPGGIRCSREGDALRLLGHAERRGTDSWAAGTVASDGRAVGLGLYARAQGSVN
jgi:hypothetical protein